MLSLNAQTDSISHSLDIVVGFTDAGQAFRLLEDGTGYLLRVQEGPFDTVSTAVISNGNVRFADIDSGSYLLTVHTGISAPFENGEIDSVVFLPTYYPSSFRWDEADTIKLREDFGDTVTMQLGAVPLTSDEQEGSLLVTMESDYYGRVRETGRVTYLFRLDSLELADSLKYYKHATSDQYGQQYFPNVPNGFYYIEPQIPGLKMDLNSFAIFEKTDICYELDLFAIAFLDVIEIDIGLGWSPCVLAIEEFKLSLFPNPANAALKIELERFPANYSVYSLDGKQTSSGTLWKHTNSLDISRLEPGIHFLQVHGRSKKFLIKRE